MARFSVPSATSSPASSPRHRRSSSKSPTHPPAPNTSCVPSATPPPSSPKRRSSRTSPEPRSPRNRSRGIVKEPKRLRWRRRDRRLFDLVADSAGRRYRVNSRLPHTSDADAAAPTSAVEEHDEWSADEICREIADGEDISQALTHQVWRTLSHPNLVRLNAVSGPGDVWTCREWTCRITFWKFCDAGSLHDLMLREKGEGLPESLIWHTLMSLLRAVLWLSSGMKDGDLEEPGGGWTPILHNLINPTNIFYRHLQDDEAMYGECRLGNFTRCLVLDNAGQALSIKDIEEGDAEGEWTGYEAPELSSHSSHNGTLGSASDVWSIGAVGVAMMTGRPLWDHVMRENIGPGRLMSRRDEDWRTLWPPERYERLAALVKGDQLLESLPLWYSRNLRELVQWMVDSNPSGRDVKVITDAAEDLYEAKLMQVVDTWEEAEYLVDVEPWETAQYDPEQFEAFRDPIPTDGVDNLEGLSASKSLNND